MQTIDHTNETWRVFDYITSGEGLQINLVNDKGKTIAPIGYMVTGSDIATFHSRARLIAAAPAMRKLVAHLEAMMVDAYFNGHPEWEELTKETRSVLEQIERRPFSLDDELPASYIALFDERGHYDGRFSALPLTFSCQQVSVHQLPVLVEWWSGKLRVLDQIDIDGAGMQTVVVTRNDAYYIIEIGQNMALERITAYDDVHSAIRDFAQQKEACV